MIRINALVRAVIAVGFLAIVLLIAGTRIVWAQAADSAPAVTARSQPEAAESSDDVQARAIAAIKKLGGVVEFGTDRPGIHVRLSGAESDADVNHRARVVATLKRTHLRLPDEVVS